VQLLYLRFFTPGGPGRASCHSKIDRIDASLERKKKKKKRMDVSILYTRIRTGLDRIPPLFFFFCSHIIGQGKTKEEEEDGREAAMESVSGISL
jgi:hypothetical protein